MHRFVPMDQELTHNVSLKQYNTFGVDASALRLIEVNSEEQLYRVVAMSEVKSLPKLIIGGGSNVLFTKDYEGLVILNRIPGIRIVEDRDDTVLVNAGGGVVWHQLVEWCIKHDFQGIENLSLIPGRCGAAPIQNIGAYGVELKESFFYLNAIELESGNKMTFTAPECRFGYRDSVFKQDWKGKLLITDITLELKRHPSLNLTYGAIEVELRKMGVGKPGVREVSAAICNIRRSKLPDPAVLGNAGSFFKNPEISIVQFEQLKKQYPGMVAFPLENGGYKLAAGWLIEQCGWKGKRVGETGSHRDQALVLVNYGNASGNEILDLAHRIIQSVADRFGVTIQPEVNIY